jgi:hypothetical protein
MLSFEDFVANIGPIFLEQIEKCVFSHHDTPLAKIVGQGPVFFRIVEIGDPG